MRVEGIEQARGYDHVVLSPHLDDAALSCGGSIAAWRAAGLRVLVVTIATADGPQGAAPGAPWSDGARRRGEDARAMSLLGADHVWAGALDAPLRSPDRFGPPRTPFEVPSPDDPLVGEMAVLVRAVRGGSPSASLHAPLAVGGHVDHRIVRAAAVGVTDAAVSLYEDFPYVLDHPADLRAALAELGRTATPRVEPIGRHLATRMAAIECYESQLDMLFGSIQTMRAAVARHATSLGPEPSERTWLVTPSFQLSERSRQ